MGGHDAGKFRTKGQKGQHVRLEQLAFIQVNYRKAEMGVRLGAAHSGEVLPAALDAGPAEVGGIHPGVGNHVLGIVSPAASGEGVGGPWIVADVQHRGKVHVHAQALRPAKKTQPQIR